MPSNAPFSLQDYTSKDGDDFFEVPLIDLTDEEDVVASGPIDIRGRSNQVRDKNREAIISAASRSAKSNQEELQKFYRLQDNSVIKCGDTVELQKPDARFEGLQSGDFMKVTQIVKKSATDQINIRGFRHVREKYLLGRGSDGKRGILNELAIHLEIYEDDDRPAEVQGLVEIPAAEIKCKRPITITNKPYPMVSFRDVPTATYTQVQTIGAFRKLIFDKGPLVCRWSRTSIISPNGQTYGGIFRHVSQKQTTAPAHFRGTSNLSRTESPASRSEILRAVKLGKRPVRTPSLEELDVLPPKRVTRPVKPGRYCFFDMFCGGGGASRGADNAGLKVLGGLDHDELAMKAWERNNPGGLPFFLDAFDFLDTKSSKIVGRCDILNISNPCQPYSAAHTVHGKNDELNIKALDTIKPAMEQLKPRILVLENTSGLANFGKNKYYFNKLLRDIMNAGPGYSLVYRVVNMADYGLPQERKRVVIIAARRGIPLPPFPKPTHGPEGSGLKPYATIGSALATLERLGERAHNDAYHRPNTLDLEHGESYDPYTKFVDCIMTSGVESLHPSGTRKFTPRELAVLQSLPLYHHLTGSRANAIKQVGNMFPPRMAELVYGSCAKTLEAFDHGLITAEDEIEDLDIALIEKGVVIPELTATPTSLFDLTDELEKKASPYYYLTRPKLSDAMHAPHSSAWQKRQLPVKATPQERKRFPERIILSDEEDDSEVEMSQPARRARNQPAKTSRRDQRFWQTHAGSTITISSGSESDSDENEDDFI